MAGRAKRVVSSSSLLSVVAASCACPRTATTVEGQLAFCAARQTLPSRKPTLAAGLRFIGEPFGRDALVGVGVATASSSAAWLDVCATARPSSA